MERIKIDDLSEDHKISNEEMRKVVGGVMPIPTPSPSYQQQYSLGTFGSLPVPMPHPISFRGALPIPIP